MKAPSISLAALALVAVVAVLTLIGCAAYQLLHTPKLKASAMAPFASIIGRDLTLQRPAHLVRTYQHHVFVQPLRLVNQDERLYEGETIAATAPAGTVLRFDEAWLYTGAVSGETTTLLLGTLRLDGVSHPFEYPHWEQRRYTGPDGRVSEGPPLRFVFPLAPWQTEADPKIYEFPKP